MTPNESGKSNDNSIIGDEKSQNNNISNQLLAIDFVPASARVGVKH